MGADEQVSESIFDFDFVEESSQNREKASEKMLDKIEINPEKVDEVLDDGLY